MLFIVERGGPRQLGNFIWKVTNRRDVKWLDKFQYHFFPKIMVFFGW